MKLCFYSICAEATQELDLLVWRAFAWNCLLSLMCYKIMSVGWQQWHLHGGFLSVVSNKLSSDVINLELSRWFCTHTYPCTKKSIWYLIILQNGKHITTFEYNSWRSPDFKFSWTKARTLVFNLLFIHKAIVDIWVGFLK